MNALSMIAASIAAAVSVLPITPAVPPGRPSRVAAVPVDVALVLAVDVSQSMDSEEQRVQRDGYVSALRSPEIVQAVAEGAHGRIAVAYVEWGGVAEQFVVADWTVIDGPDAAAGFANRLAETPLRSVQRTSISSALSYSAGMIDAAVGSGIAPERRVIDISGDGPNNQGGPVTAARDAVAARGITINGLPLMLGGAGYTLPNLDAYFEDCVIGGPGSFLIPVRGLDGFADAIRRKLVLEIAGRDAVAATIPAAVRPPVDCSMFD